MARKKKRKKRKKRKRVSRAGQKRRNKKRRKLREKGVSEADVYQLVPIPCTDEALQT